MQTVSARSASLGHASVRHWLGAALFVLAGAGGAAAMALAGTAESEALENAESAALDSLHFRMAELEASNRLLAAKLARARQELAGLEREEHGAGDRGERGRHFRE